MKISKSGLDLLKHWEQLRLKPYHDSRGVPTVGWGHTKIAPVLMDAGITLTPEQADLLLRHDLADAELAVGKWTVGELTQNQYDALVVFTYNVGSGGLSKSTLRDLVNKRQFTDAAPWFEPYCKETKNGKKTYSRGLHRRRITERAVFEGKDWVKALAEWDQKYPQGNPI